MAGLAWAEVLLPADDAPVPLVVVDPGLAPGLAAGAGALAAGGVGVLVLAEATVPLALARLAGTAGKGLAAGCTAATVRWTTRVAPGTTPPAAEAVAGEDDAWGVLAGGGLWAAVLVPACPDEPTAAGAATDDTGNEADGTASPAT